MGTCCVVQHKQDQGELNATEQATNQLALFEGDEGTMKKVRQIQSVYRGYRVRSTIKPIKKPPEKQEKQERTTGVPDGTPNVITENPVVLEVEKALGPFQRNLNKEEAEGGKNGETG